MSNKDKIKKQIFNKIFKADDFIKKICYGNAGMLNMGNIWCFDYAISHIPSKAPIIEIGSFCGLSANVITYIKLKHKKNNPLICIDPWDFSEGNELQKLGEHPTLNNKDYGDFVKRSFQENLLLFSSYDLPFAIQITSDNFFRKWNGKEKVNNMFQKTIQLGGDISFAYIDGNHDYDYAYRDFQNVDRCLSIGGFILFDDSADNSGWGVCEVVKELCRNDKYKLIKQNPNYFFKKIN
ncbi:MAG: class I SAM-dependent methyltransferase [Okeania sp. SIO2G4]|uniref:class I SAM-dependent methyltransferase n=1 Tax=unclassified Okeania TaxID=2634635 RepID=UPI0013BAA80F|nr:MULTISPECIES: class I SAM-dependent methyltransferase [unclassified Okeania]NEP08248.1 class I SAM-dependent methyltransferase [Okeania sp. SIO4D6]NEP41672.1 class I SAM-dependent methyltransferase [Okeania sp. SIO2H7]NEP72059.1 class I SAM-dependent methyltransferase [Okeania sp. SIO2G5]NEP92915.1 class I SAM-dependent methyltransferase [Okeania sp. SIO2F5]NEQ94112.1 class I SAM-dependent methyltransferase [Okeania sp. SIO2G4]